MKWEKVAKVANIKTGKYDANHSVKEGKYKFYTCALEPLNANTYSFEGKLIIIPGNGANLGEVMYYEGKIEAYQRTYVLHNIEGNPKYIYYYLKKIWKNHIRKNEVGSATNYMKLKDISDLEIPLPPREIQIKIAEALDKAQELINNRKLQLEKYDELIQSTFIDMFGDPVLNTKKWKLKKIGEVSSCIVPGRDKPKSFTGKIPWITTPDLIKNGVTFTSKKNIGLTKEEIQTVKAKLIPVNSVVMSCVGDLGITTLVGKEMIINQQLHAFICNNNLNPYFLRAVIPYQKNYMYSVATTTTIPYLNKSNCNNIPIILPPIELQNKFASIVKIIENEKKLCEESLKQIEENFDSMIDKAFKGELF